MSELIFGRDEAVDVGCLRTFDLYRSSAELPIQIGTTVTSGIDEDLTTMSSYKTSCLHL